MGKKAFFTDRTVPQIRKLSVARVSNQKSLVERIADIDPSQDALELRFKLVPGQFYRGKVSGGAASKKFMKYGDVLALSQPRLQRDAIASSEFPVRMRYESFKQLASMREEEVFVAGYSWKGTGRDDVARMVPFIHSWEGTKLFAYSELRPDTQIVVSVYPDTTTVPKSGTYLVASVPSRTRGKSHYTVSLVHVPYHHGSANLNTILNLRQKTLLDEDTNEPLSDRPENDTHFLRYGDEGERSRIEFYPQDIAAYIKLAGEEWKQHNMTPMDMNPFVLPSQQGVDFYKNLCNNVVIFDPTVSSAKNGASQLRHLNEAEKSILLARGIRHFGHDDFAYWEPTRDGKLKDYDWSVPGKDHPPRARTLS